MKFKLTAALGAMSLGFALQAQAAAVTDNISITTSGYADITGAATAPIDPLNVDFDVTFDPTEAYTTSPISLLTPLNSAFSGLSLMFYTGGGTFNLEGTSGQTSLNFQYIFDQGKIIPGTYQFVSGESDYATYSFNGRTDLFGAQPGLTPSGSGEVVITQVSAAPEPASWALILFGVFGAGATLRQAKRYKSGAAVGAAA